MKQFRWKIVICLLPVLVAALIVGRAWTQYSDGKGGFKLGVDLAGGTILVYEVADPEAKVDMNLLAAALKRRIDPADLYNVTIRPVGEGRVEIILPTGNRKQVQAQEVVWQGFLEKVAQKWPPKGGKTYEDISRGDIGKLIERIRQNDDSVKTEDIDAFIRDNYQGGQERRGLTGEEVERIKELIARQGSLEFRILANERDDGPALEAARNLFAEAKKDRTIRDTLDQLARTGKPPLPPRNAQGGNTFPSADGTTYSYTWVELGPEERHQLGLDNAAQEDADPRRREAWQRAATARKNGEPITMLNGALLYSRDFTVPAGNVVSKDRDKKVEYFFLTRDAEPGKAVTGDDLLTASGDVDEKLQPMVRFRFKSAGGDRFHELTSKNKPVGEHYRHLAIVLDNQIMSAPRIQSPIRTEGSITNMSSSREVDTLVTILKAGALPATLKPRPVAENTIGATLGEDTIRSGAIAVVLAFVAVLVFMIIYYRFAGLVASVALLANLLLTVAFMTMTGTTFTLPGLAGLVLTLGMAVDANVLIYERLREERDRGASLALAIRNGYDRAFPTIIDTHLTSIFTAIVLYVVGNDQLKGFGISLTVGLVISLFTSLYMTRTVFDLALAQGWLTRLTMMRLLSRPNINFMGIRNYVFAFTVISSIIGLALFLYRGQKGLNIDFVGGTAYTAALVEPMTIQSLRDELGKQAERLKVLEVRPINDDGGNKTFEVVYDDGDGKKDVRLVHVDESVTETNKPPTKEEVQERAVALPDYSLEMIYLNDPGYSIGNRSRVFTVRTTEKAPELVQTAVSRLLGERLKRVKVSAEITDSDKGQAKTALLTFTDPVSGEQEFASPARVTALLAQEFALDDLLKRQLVVAGEGKEKEGLFHQAKVTLPQAISEQKFKDALTGLSDQYANNPQPFRLENFDSQLAGKTQQSALTAILASWVAILLYLWFRFGNWTFGLAAVCCLVHDLCLTLGVIAACHYLDHWVPGVAHLLGLQDFKIDLAAIASLLTLVGYSVNDTIVVFDRIREVRGKNPALTPQMINDSVNQTLSRTVLASLTTWLVVIVLYIWGGAGVHLFAFVMVVGVLIGTFSSIYVASPLLLLFGEGRQAASRARPSQPVGTTA